MTLRKGRSRRHLRADGWGDVQWIQHSKNAVCSAVLWRRRMLKGRGITENKEAKKMKNERGQSHPKIRNDLWIELH